MALADWIWLAIVSGGFVFWLRCLCQVDDWIDENEDDWLSRED